MHLSVEFLCPGAGLNTEANTHCAISKKTFASSSCLDLFLAMAQTSCPGSSEPSTEMHWRSWQLSLQSFLGLTENN